MLGKPCNETVGNVSPPQVLSVKGTKWVLFFLFFFFFLFPSNAQSKNLPKIWTMLHFEVEAVFKVFFFLTSDLT